MSGVFSESIGRILMKFSFIVELTSFLLWTELNFFDQIGEFPVGVRFRLICFTLRKNVTHVLQTTLRYSAQNMPRQQPPLICWHFLPSKMLFHVHINHRETVHRSVMLHGVRWIINRVQLIFPEANKNLISPAVTLAQFILPVTHSRCIWHYG